MEYGSRKTRGVEPVSLMRSLLCYLFCALSTCAVCSHDGSYGNGGGFGFGYGGKVLRAAIQYNKS